MENEKKSKKKLYRAIAIAVVGMIIFGVVVMEMGVIILPSSNSNVVPQGKVIMLPTTSYHLVKFTVFGSGIFAGAISVAGSEILLFLLTPSAVENLQSSSGLQFVYTTGFISNGSFNTTIGSGTYYVMFYNVNSHFSSMVTINSLTFTYTT